VSGQATVDIPVHVTVDAGPLLLAKIAEVNAAMATIKLNGGLSQSANTGRMDGAAAPQRGPIVHGPH
jgi:hypothetical protein